MRTNCSSRNRGAQPRQAERVRNVLGGDILPGGHAPRFGPQPARRHLVGETARGEQVALDCRAGCEGPAALGPDHPVLAAQLVEGAADGDKAAAVAACKLALCRKALTRLPLTRLEGGTEVLVNLVVQRNRAGSDLETCQSTGDLAAGLDPSLPAII